MFMDHISKDADADLIVPAGKTLITMTKILRNVNK